MAFSGPVAKPPVGARIDWGHPLARDLIHAVWFNTGASRIARDEVTHDQFLTSRNNADTRYQNGQMGMEFLNNASGGVTGLFTSNQTVLLGASSVSVGAIFAINATNGSLEPYLGGQGGTLFSCRINLGDTSPTLLYNNQPGAIKGMFIADANGVAVGARTSTTLTTSRYYSLVGTFNADGTATYGGVWQTYLDGIADGTTNSVNIAGSYGGTFTNGKYAIGGSPRATSTSAINLVTVQVWRRCLNADEVARWTADPYAYARPAPRRLFNSSGAASAFKAFFANQIGGFIGVGVS